MCLQDTFAFARRRGGRESQKLVTPELMAAVDFVLADFLELKATVGGDLDWESFRDGYRFMDLTFENYDDRSAGSAAA